ncbi:MAG: Hsp20/alpha crystallin family protein [Candidatus Thermoplasmatota archaeon]|jgi:HSP20 family protein|nr:Hsp20/alpha crystallin family protein [Candidatus Thermoplasmatota archaeon]MCL5964020.1 Hsp20/alpha crystallin family protein [Candidatus Thermoplasmatota archaeon]
MNDKIKKIERMDGNYWKNIEKIFDSLRMWPYSSFNDMYNSRFPLLFDELPHTTPLSDIIENDKQYQIEVEMPGIKKEDIEINLSQNTIEISANTKKENREDKNGKTILKERLETTYHRFFELPEDIIPDDAKATFENGILTITLPKTESSKTPRIKLKID